MKNFENRAFFQFGHFFKNDKSALKNPKMASKNGAENMSLLNPSFWDVFQNNLIFVDRQKEKKMSRILQDFLWDFQK